MFGIVLTILKIIGIILLVILCLLLVLLLLVLFVPVRYRAQGSGKLEDASDDQPAVRQIDAAVRVTWLFHFISVRAHLQGKQMQAALKVLGIPIIRIPKPEKQERPGKQKKSKKQSEKTKADHTDFSEPEEIGKTEVCLMVPEMKPEPSESIPPVSEKNEIDKPQRFEKEAEQETDQSKKETEKKEPLSERLVRRIRKIFNQIKEKAASLKKKAEALTEKKDSVTGFLSDEQNREAISLVLRKGKALLRSILPKKVRGEVLFDRTDPAAVGKILSIIGIFYPVYGEDLKIVPIFENRNYLNGELALSGKIQFYKFVKTAVSIWFNKKFKRLLKQGKSLRQSLSS